MLDPGHLALTQIAQHLALLQKWITASTLLSPELPQQIAALYEWFSARCRWKEKALTQRGLLVQAGEQSEQIFTRWRAGAYNALVVAWALFYRSRRVALGGIWRCLSSGKPASGGVVAG